MLTVPALIYNALLWALWVVYVNLGLDRRFSLPVTIGLEMAGWIPFIWMTAFVSAFPSFWKSLLGYIFVILFFFAMHKGKWYTRMLYSISILLITTLAEILVYLLAPEEMATAQSDLPYDYSIPLFAVGFVANMILFALAALFWNTIRKRFAFGLFAPKMLLLLSFPLIQVLILVFLLPAIRDGGRFTFSHLETVLLILSILVPNIILFYLIRVIAKNTAEESALSAREQTAALQQRYYESLENSAGKLSSLRKRLAQKVAFLSDSLQMRDGAAAEKVTADILSDPLLVRRFPACSRRVVADFLGSREQELSEKGIRTSFSASLPAELSITDPDLISLLGNLLDNAEAACEETEEPFIRLEMDYQIPYVRIKMENRFSETQKPSIRTDEKPERGLGTWIIHDLAERYDGEYRTIIDGSVWTSSLMLKGMIRS